MAIDRSTTFNSIMQALSDSTDFLCDAKHSDAVNYLQQSNEILGLIKNLPQIETQKNYPRFSELAPSPRANFDESEENEQSVNPANQNSKGKFSVLKKIRSTLR